jgi:hypothetical protein
MIRVLLNQDITNSLSRRPPSSAWKEQAAFYYSIGPWYINNKLILISKRYLDNKSITIF